MERNSETDTVWELQEQLRVWHEQEYRQAYPGSTFVTGHLLASHGRRAWDELTPEEQERKEWAAYRLNCVLFSLGVNLSGQFREVSSLARSSPRCGWFATTRILSPARQRVC